MRQPKFCITAINRLTRQREPVTRSLTRQMADSMLAKEKAKPPAKRTWIYPKVEYYPPQQLYFNFKD